ncbi:MAG: 50S ribosomal protein L32 [Patescibacteria group bacterium]
MGLPGKRLSRSSKRRRAAHFALKPKSFVVCPKCEKQMMPHRACPTCGTYKGRVALKLKQPKLAGSAKAAA